MFADLRRQQTGLAQGDFRIPTKEIGMGFLSNLAVLVAQSAPAILGLRIEIA